MSEPPRVRIAKPSSRPYQLRYTDPATGREVRLSTGSHELLDAETEKRKLEARLLLGTDIPRRRRKIVGPDMLWEDFREIYYARHLAHLRKSTRINAESRLTIAARFLKVATLSDMASRDALVRLRDWRLTEGSKHYARSFMASVRAALNWAAEEGFIEHVPRIPKIKTSKMRAMKGRPITGEEFERMLAETPAVVGPAAAESYEHVLRGLWASALRIGELMSVSWDIPDTIHPVWPRGREPVLRIPAALQKNETEEDIPLVPWFDELLNATPQSERHGWVFNPASLNQKFRRKPRVERPSPQWVSKVISRIGKRANVLVATGKFASAHDLRRSCGERLLNSGVPEKVVQRVLRHESWETTRRFYTPGSVQADAKVLREALACT